LASLAGTVLRTGGTEKMTGDEIDEELEFLAASIESSIGREMGVVTLSCHSKDLERCLEIFADVLMRPRFADDKMEIQRGRMKDGIRRQNDDPSDIAQREFPLAVYGKDNPWARVPTLESVDRITREDLVLWHSRYYHPNNILLGAAGDFDSAKLTTLLEKVFLGWEREEVVLPSIAPVDTSVNPRVVYVPKDLQQTTIRMGHFGYNRLSPDRFPIEVLNYIYGYGGFRSRLMMEVRSNLGLAYSVGGYIGRGTDIGLFFAACETKPGSSIEAIRVMTRITDDMRARPVTEQELRDAIEAMSNQFVFLFDAPAKIVDQAVDYTYYHYPEDFLDTYLRNLQAVTAEDVLRVAREYLHPDKMVILVVGEKEKFDGDLSALGPVEVLELE
jgi:predicted Zn-dependent peptidase